MGYRKFRSDHLFTGQEMLDDRHVLITDGEGQIETITELENAGEGIEYLPGIISPGFVNCHCHLELSHMKGMIPKHTGMTDFLISVISNRFVEEKTIYEAMNRADEEMLVSGIIAIGDICNTSHSIMVKEKS